ncbi:hypothetical protein JW926_17825 [Candidatus Sumerlaeota bacterium]|nr:hypothetical protein [Candidatus Sumerlaeota bacterium]
MLSRLQDVFKSFENHDVRYVVIGGIAAVLHGVPRSTFDLDILIEATLENARRLLNALRDAQFTTADLTDEQKILSHEISVFQDRVRIDVQTKTPGLSFEQAWKNRVRMHYNKHSFFVVSKSDLIKSKSASGRQIDLEDAAILKSTK